MSEKDEMCKNPNDKDKSSCLITCRYFWVIVQSFVIDSSAITPKKNSKCNAYDDES